MLEGRTVYFERNKKLEKTLKELNGLLNISARQIVRKYEKPKYPVMFVVGGPRTGTTLVMQWLAGTKVFSYPSNLLSRFYAAPSIGARIQLLLTDPKYAFRDELNDICQNDSYESDLGKTCGAMSPNEFWYFWRRFMPNSTPRYLSPHEESQVKVDKLLAEVAAIEAVFNKPFILKALILLFNIDLLAKAFENAVFLFIKRSELYTVQSLLEARRRFFGTTRKWYSIKPMQYEHLKKLDSIAQVAGQVYYINEALINSAESLKQSRYLEVEYEKFCADPKTVYSEIIHKYDNLGYKIRFSYTGPGRFQNRNILKVSKLKVNRIISAYKEFSGQTISV
jgi:hypothetical protein